MTLCMYGHFTGSPRARATRGYSRAGRKKAEAGRAGKESVAFCLACETDKLSGLRYYCHLSLVCSFVRKPRI